MKKWSSILLFIVVSFGFSQEVQAQTLSALSAQSGIVRGSSLLLGDKIVLEHQLVTEIHTEGELGTLHRAIGISPCFGAGIGLILGIGLMLPSLVSGIVNLVFILSYNEGSLPFGIASIISAVLGIALSTLSIVDSNCTDLLVPHLGLMASQLAVGIIGIVSIKKWRDKQEKALSMSPFIQRTPQGQTQAGLALSGRF